MNERLDEYKLQEARNTAKQALLDIDGLEKRVVGLEQIEAVLEAKFDSLRQSHRAFVGGFIALCVTVIGSAAAIIISIGGSA